MSEEDVFKAVYNSVVDALQELESRGFDGTHGVMHRNTLRDTRKAAVQTGYGVAGESNAICGVKFTGVKTIPEGLIIVYDRNQAIMQPEAIAVAWVELENTNA